MPARGVISIYSHGDFRGTLAVAGLGFFLRVPGGDPLPLWSTATRYHWMNE